MKKHLFILLIILTACTLVLFACTGSGGGSDDDNAADAGETDSGDGADDDGSSDGSDSGGTDDADSGQTDEGGDDADSGGSGDADDSGDDDTDQADSGGLNNAAVVSGTVRSANGDPVSGVTVYIPGVTVSASLERASRSFSRAVVAPDGTLCEDPPAADNALASACSAADGTFSLDTSGVAAADQIVFQKGALSKIQDLACTNDPCVLDAAATTFDTGATWPKVAVVTGNYDRIEDVLAKLADPDTSDGANGSYGRVDPAYGNFVYGSEYQTNLTIIDGTGYLTPVENTDVVQYHQWTDYFDGTRHLTASGKPVFDVVFINCGNSYEYTILSDTAKVSILQNYVSAGGRLYVTDLSYDFVEQPFPQVMKFSGDPDDAGTPGSLGAAEYGTSGVTIDAVVNDNAFASWLKTVTVNRHDSQTPGNPDEDCVSAVNNFGQVTGALTAAGLIPLGDFLSGWAHMVGAHSAQSPTIWISAGSGVSFDGLENRPLTVSMSIGSQGGKVIYSSYHTAESCPTTTFWPQERVMQYLIFEAF